MSKVQTDSSKIDGFADMISKLGADISKQLEVSERDFSNALRKNEELTAGYEKLTDRLFKRDPDEDRRLDEELKKMAGEMGIKLDPRKPSTSDDYIEREYQRIKDELKQEGAKFEEQPKLSDSLEFSLILLESHGKLADNLVDKSTDKNEKEELAKFSEKNRKFSAILDNISGEDNKSKIDQMDDKSKMSLMSNIAVGIEKLYSSIKSGVSKALDGIKELGSKLVNAVKSTFSKPPKEQNVAFSNVATGTKKAIDSVKEPSEKLKVAGQNLKDGYRKLQEQYGKIIPKERQQAFKKFQEVHDAEKMTHPELLKETKRLAGAMIKQLQENSKAATQAYKESRAKRTALKKPERGM
jgi:hypothetical protein